MLCFLIVFPWWLLNVKWPVGKSFFFFDSCHSSVTSNSNFWWKPVCRFFFCHVTSVNNQPLTAWRALISPDWQVEIWCWVFWAVAMVAKVLSWTTDTLRIDSPSTNSTQVFLPKKYRLWNSIKLNKHKKNLKSGCHYVTFVSWNMSDLTFGRYEQPFGQLFCFDLKK